MLKKGIARGTVSDKTTVVKKIGTKFLNNELAMFSHDSFYNNNSNMQERRRTTDQGLNCNTKTVRPIIIRGIKPTKQFADIIVPQGGRNSIAIQILSNHISQTLNKS